MIMVESVISGKKGDTMPNDIVEEVESRERMQQVIREQYSEGLITATEYARDVFFIWYEGINYIEAIAREEG